MKPGILILLITSIFIFSAEETEAQIWKKIKNKTKQKVEEKVSDKISDKLAEVIIGKMNEKFAVSSNPYKGGTKISKPENLPESYSFDWSYKIKVTNSGNSENEITFDYKLTNESNYFGYIMPESPEMFSVVDSDNQAIVSYMEEEGNPYAMSYSYPVSEVSENAYIPGAAQNVTITELDEKSFLGYTAKGYEIDTPQSTMIVYLTSEAEVNFSGFTGLPGQGIPQAFINNIDDVESTLMLYMKFTDKSNSENAMEMVCISLEKEPFTKNNADYNFL